MPKKPKTLPVAPEGWIVHTIKVRNFTIIFRDPTEGDYLNNEGAPGEQERAFYAGLVVKWNCTDYQGNPLPISGESFLKLPTDVRREMARVLLEGINDPKAKGENAA